MQECGIDTGRAVAFLKVRKEEVEQMYIRKSLDCDILLCWCKLLEYDFFRTYSLHLILYAPQYVGNGKGKKKVNRNDTLLSRTGGKREKTYKQIQKEYNIPSTTILRWCHKYGKTENEEK